MDDADDPIARRMRALSDEELQRVIGPEADDWQPAAIAVAHQELVRRNVVGVAPFREGEHRRSGPAAPAPDRRRPNMAKGVPLAILLGLLIKVILLLLR